MRGAQPIHVALNLVFLVPGETGGMETYARELIPRLAARDDCGSPRWSTAKLPRRRRAWGESCRWSSFRSAPAAGSSGCAASNSTCPRIAARAGADVVHSLASTAPLCGPCRG